MELWRARPGDVIVLPVFPGEVTVLDVGLGSSYHARRVEWEGPGGMSGALDLGEFTEVGLLAAGDGVNKVWLNPPGPECRVYGLAGGDQLFLPRAGRGADHAVPRPGQGCATGSEYWVKIDREASRRVAAGVVFMDTADPGWWREDIEQAIDLADFDISRPDACVLAQRCPLAVLAERAGALDAQSLLDGDMDEAYFVNAARLSRGVVQDGETLTEWARAHGFTGNRDEMAALAAGWKRVITERRQAARRECTQRPA